MNLLFDFTADKATNTIRITREFAADLDLVWDAFTKAEIIDRWTAPKPYRSETRMDFREGGRSITAMIAPDGATRYSLAEFIKIEPKTFFSTRNSFCNENGAPVSDGFSLTTNSFKAGGEITTVYIEKKFDTPATLEMMVSGGYKEGMAMALANLDNYFGTLVGSK